MDIWVDSSLGLLFKKLLLLLKNWIHLFVDVKKKTHPSQSVGEGRTYHLQLVRRTPGIFPTTVSPQQQNRKALS